VAGAQWPKPSVFDTLPRAPFRPFEFDHPAWPTWII
jgi:hypothetical protein